MMPTAALHHSARLRGVQTQLLRILPPTAYAAPANPGARPDGTRSSAMNRAFLLTVRAYTTLKGSFALVGIAAVAALLALPQQRQALLSHFPSVSILSFSADPFASTLASGAIQVSAAD